MRCEWLWTWVCVLFVACGCSSSSDKCTTDADCGEGKVCGPDGICYDKVSCEDDADCKADEYCDAGGVCRKRVVDEDGGTGEDGSDGGDDQPADEGPPPCEHDRECPPDKVCEAGACVDGSPCSADYNCDKETEYCHPEGGVCKDRSALCEPCQESYECPDPGMGDMCIDYPDGRFCGQRCGVQACPAGYECDLTAGSGTGPNPGQCRSNTGSCEGTFICHEDDDCAANQVCNKQTGNCVPKCTDDSRCAGGLKCHYTGHCGPPCTADGDCAVYGDDLICCTAPGVPVEYCDDNAVGKCRPAGCVLHSECLQDSGDSLGYCDKRTHTCMPGCRAADPMTINDCKSGMYCDCINGEVSCSEMDCCSDPGGACLCDPAEEDCSQVNVCDNGVCKEIPCHERGDVDIACARNQVCCGFPIDDYYTCPTDTEVGECYMAPKEIWCSPCGTAGDPCEVDGYGHGEPGICLEDGGDGNTYCHLACRSKDDCPATWQCDYAYVQGCEEASHCEPSASCELVYRGEDDQGEVQEVNACHCQTDDDCPDDINGFESFCIEQQICDYTVEPVECHPGKVCKFAKTCQCPNCCSELHSGG